MDFQQYGTIDYLILNESYDNKFEIKHEGDKFTSVLWKFKNSWKGAHQENIGYGNRIKGSLEQSENPKKYNNLVGPHDKIGPLTSLEILIKNSGFSIVSERIGHQTRTYISKNSFWKPAENQVVGIVKPTFSEGFHILNQMQFDSENLGRILYADSVRKAVNKF